MEQSEAQKESNKELQDLEDARIHNVQLMNEYHGSDEGNVDLETLITSGTDARIANAKKIEKDIRNEIKAMKIKDPAVGKYYE